MDKEFFHKVTILSGILCSDWLEFRKYCDKLIGYSLYTHEYANKDLWLELNIRLITRHTTDRDKHPLEILFETCKPKNTIVLIKD